jgi:hypothetical protein|tara:strand:+ start:1244 stop:1414 length:171 start_codon:yes stop_codon:yes gene_type:complete
MMKSLQPEDFHKSLYEELLMPNKEIKEQVDRQNVVIGFILGCLLVGGIVLMCMILL